MHLDGIFCEMLSQTTKYSIMAAFELSGFIYEGSYFRDR